MADGERPHDAIVGRPHVADGERPHDAIVGRPHVADGFSAHAMDVGVGGMAPTYVIGRRGRGPDVRGVRGGDVGGVAPTYLRP